MAERHHIRIEYCVPSRSAPERRRSGGEDPRGVGRRGRRRRGRDRRGWNLRRARRRRARLHEVDARPVSAAGRRGAAAPREAGRRVAAAILRLLADVAQLVERLLAMQKVDGSSPFIRFRKALETGPLCPGVTLPALRLQARLQADQARRALACQPCGVPGLGRDRRRSRSKGSVTRARRQRARSSVCESVPSCVISG